MSRTERLNPATKVVVKTKPSPASRATASFSHMGGRPTQQDACQIWENTAIGATFVVVCDGVGGSRSGAEASAVVVQTAGQLWKDRGGAFSDPKKDLLSLSNVARNRIADLAVAGEKRAPASTIVALYLTLTEAHWIHAGDSRLYHFRNSQLVSRTRDHSVVQILVDQGEVTEEEMGSHPDQGRLLQSLGAQEYRDPTYGTASIGQTDAFVLCTDGFWERTPWKAMASIFHVGSPNLESELRRVVNRAVQANGPSGDNVTAAIVAPLIPPAKSPTGDFVKAFAPYLPYLCIAALVLGGVGLGVYKWANPEPPTVVINPGSGDKVAVLPPKESPAVSHPASSTPLVPSPSPVATAKPSVSASPTPALASPTPAAATPAPNEGAAPAPTPSPGLSGFPAPNVISSLPPNLPVPSGTAARDISPGAASKDRPYVNTLGMRFVPVKIDEGLAAERQVLFSIWDTRVQDFEAFEKAKRLKPFYSHDRKSKHPIVNVTWDQAKDFCAWLTEKERRNGKIGPYEAYRLPTDLEWSCAVGLEESAGARGGRPPKSGNNENVYPWGPAFPPPNQAGNYAPQLKVDEFELTSPVGSFAPNRNGLYDMGGNVWQWCEDAYNANMNSPEAIKKYPYLERETTRQGNPLRVIRGASWNDGDEVLLRSAFRENGDHAIDTVGFRCVLEGSGS